MGGERDWRVRRGIRMQSWGMGLQGSERGIKSGGGRVQTRLVNFLWIKNFTIYF